MERPRLQGMTHFTDYLTLRTLRAKFLAVIVPLFLLSTLMVFGIAELTAYRDANRKLQNKLNDLASIQSAVLSESLWNVADDQIDLILAALAVNPDFLGAVVYDESDNPVSSVGTIEALETKRFFAERDITYTLESEPEVIGRLAIALTDASLQAESGSRLMIASGLAALLLLLVVTIALLANRRTIGVPLERLLDSINHSRETGRTKPVTWRSKDEMGEVVSAFNELQARQQASEAELRQARDDLERRVEERTEELASKSNALEQLSNQLAKYLPPQVYESIFQGKQEVKVASSRKKLTVFFSDIAGFTETADRLESEELTELVNHYLTEMSRIALDYGATIDKYMGDGIMIFFGDPETRGVRDDALACIKMAIAMRDRMLDLEDIWRESGIERPLRVRMGVHTGFCTVGNFGSEDRLDYTIVGAAANIASRLEALATPGEILISYETFSQVKDLILCKEQGKIEIKGLAYPLATYEVVSSYETLGEARRHFCEEHPNVKVDLALDAMTEDDRHQAADVLQRALDLISVAEKTRPEPRLKAPARPRRQARKRRTG